MDGEWENQFEEDGVTLGPEEALRREIEKSKALKVDRLNLRNEVEKLQREVRDLTVKTHLQEQEIARNPRQGSPAKTLSAQNIVVGAASANGSQIRRGLVLFILAFNISVIGLLVYFQLQK